MKRCISCGRECVDFVSFPCPECGEEIVRCKKCRVLKVPYTCKKCGFTGP